MGRGSLVVMVLAALSACSQPVTATSVPATTAVEAPTAPAAAMSIPEAFLGRWDTSAERCTSSTSDTHMTIAAAEITYFESGGNVSSVTVTTPKDISVTMSMSGEGETWERTSRMTLSEDGGTLTIDDIARVRCS